MTKVAREDDLVRGVKRSDRGRPEAFGEMKDIDPFRVTDRLNNNIGPKLHIMKYSQTYRATNPSLPKLAIIQDAGDLDTKDVRRGYE